MAIYIEIKDMDSEYDHLTNAEVCELHKITQDQIYKGLQYVQMFLPDGEFEKQINSKFKRSTVLNMSGLIYRHIKAKQNV